MALDELSIEAWLETIAPSSAPLDRQKSEDKSSRKRRSTMPTPPASSSMPSKRRRVDRTAASSDTSDNNSNNDETNNDETTNDDDDVHRTPRAPTLKYNSATSLTMRPPTLRSSNASTSNASSSLASSGQRRRERSTSPVKTTQHLQQLEKPISCRTIRENENLPADIADLFTDIYLISSTGEATLPVAVRPELKHELGRLGPREHEIRQPEGEQGQAEAEAARAAALIELAELRKILKQARLSWDTRRIETGWTGSVHWPLLNLALEHEEENLNVEFADTVSIAPKFVPRWNAGGPGGGMAASKMIDMVVTLRSQPALVPASGNEEQDAAVHLGRAIREVLSLLPPDEQTVNQTCYSTIHDQPIGIAIEAKSRSGSAEEGLVQLGVWTAAWHKRIQVLRRGRDSGLLPSLPLLLTVGHTWTLYFACDRRTQIDIIGGIPLGDTSSMRGLYRLLAGIRRLGKWMTHEYKDWWLDTLQELSSGP